MSKNIAIIGCGIFGATIALKLQKEGFNVSIFERKKEILKGASYNNQNRLHLGFHYPRDIETARQCIKGFNKFKSKFPDCIRKVKENLYFIASENSFTTVEDYLKFCTNIGVKFSQLDLNNLPIKVNNVDLGIKSQEVVYDCELLQKIILEQVKNKNIPLFLNTSVNEINKQENSWALKLSNGEIREFDAVVNSSYANINYLTEQLQENLPEHQYEYTAVPIIKGDFGNIGITIMDGEFMTLLPFGKSNKFLLYHVKHAVIDRVNQILLPENWLDKSTSPFSKINKELFFQKIKKSCSQYLPAVKDAQLVGFLEGPRMVLANKDHTDERPSIINKYDQTYLTVFSGKIDHCVWVSDDIANYFLTIF